MPFPAFGEHIEKWSEWNTKTGDDFLTHNS
jgi:hypothetical protein